MMEILWEEGDGSVGRIWVDATIRESHQSTAEVTDHPVERGVNIVDHVRPEADQIAFDVVISNTPIVEPESHMDGATGEVQGFDLPLPSQRRMERGAVRGEEAEYEPVNQSAGVQVLAFDAPFDRARAVYDELRRLQTTATLLQLVTTLREYDNMVLRSITAPREGRDGVTFAVEAQQIRIAESEVVEVPIPESPRGRNERNRGPQPTDEETDGQKEEKSRGILVQGRDFLRGFGF
jgi:hypothetical protein